MATSTREGSALSRGGRRSSKGLAEPAWGGNLGSNSGVAGSPSLKRKNCQSSSGDVSEAKRC
eukprot:CAMPEP_0180534420 /NCGR_PEP_ID=MMETSP1036_2-20121128/64162_1 /TAXON_ID=632150 /ORGANISM="Azadinium spinosum, Strain 3D9" /LENGTH=61 /DNA_ID=CAMNT_0022548725 /DNA_START=75 /DNA_END=257 /DNA_ORIENTATION=-